MGNTWGRNNASGLRAFKPAGSRREVESDAAFSVLWKFRRLTAAEKLEFLAAVAKDGHTLPTTVDAASRGASGGE